MAEDVWSALVRGALAFAHSRAGTLVNDSFQNTGALVGSLFDHSPPGTTQERLKALKEKVEAAKDEIKPLIDAVQPQVEQAQAALQAMGDELGTEPFTWEAAARATTELGRLLSAFDAALGAVGKTLADAEPGADEAARREIEQRIRGIDEPWKAPFRNLGADALGDFELLCQVVLGIDHAGAELAQRLAWDQPGKRLALKLTQVRACVLGPLALDGASVEGFFSFQKDAVLGVTVRAKLQAGLRGDKLLQKIIPGQAPTADSEATAVTLDTERGLTFGDARSRKLVLPARFDFPGVELRELALALPDDEVQQRRGRLDLMATVAARLGSVVGAVAEGGGLFLRWRGADGGGPIEVLPKPPHSTGLRLDAGLVKGGGFLRYIEERGEYGGVLDLQLTKLGVTAIGLIGTEPELSLVIVIGVHFIPRIELGLGFTLNGLGGLLAIERRVDTDALRQGIRDGSASLLLFPENPVDAAPRILDRLGQSFPYQGGGFVVGPMAELGWGSQAGFLKARLGVLLALPDPRIVLLGALQVGVPTAETPEKLRIVDLRAELFGEITPDYLLLRVALNGSRLAGIPVSGDLGLLVRWAGGADFALSVGGFFPKYAAPAELADLRRIALQLNPPVSWVQVRGEGYFAITANTLQFGGRIDVSAKLGPASGEAHLGVDALFQWSPRYRFVFLVDAGIDIKAFGRTVCGASFRGELSGMAPWHLEGHASVTILWWDVPLDVGPIEWGPVDTATPEALSPAAVAAQALRADAAWTPQLPAGADQLVQLIPDAAAPPLLVHPLGALELRQQQVPLETTIDRIGSNPVKARRAHLAAPQVDGADAAAVAHATDLFPPGHFIDMKDDEQLGAPAFETRPSGLRLAAQAGADTGAPVSAESHWETVYPHEPALARGFGRLRLEPLGRLAFRTNAVAQATRLRGNPYLTEGAPAATAQVGLVETGRVEVRRRSDLSPVAGLEGAMSTAEALVALRGAGPELQLLRAGVAP